MTTETPDPRQTGIDHLRTIDETAMRVWKVKAPKGVPGEISGVLFAGSVLIMHQLPSGKFVVFEKVDPAKLGAAE